MRPIATWLVIALTAVFLFGGLEIASLADSAGAVDAETTLLAKAPPWLFLAVGIPVVALEGLFWTVAFVELGNRFHRSLWLGAAAGVLAYGVVFHWSGGAFAIAVSSWIVLVLNTSYVLLRSRSQITAIFSTIGHKVAFVLYAAVGIYSHAGG